MRLGTCGVLRVLLLCGLYVEPWLLQLLWWLWWMVEPDSAPLLCCGACFR